MTTLFICQIDIKTLELEESAESGDEYDYYPEATSPDAEEAMFGGAAGYATYDDFAEGSIYAESLVSAEDARRLVYEKCRELSEQFASALKKLTQGD